MSFPSGFQAGSGAGGGGGSSPTDVLTTQGDILSQNPSGTYVRIPRGVNGQMLTQAASIPAWTNTPSGTVLDWQYQFTVVGAGPAAGAEINVNNVNWSLVTSISIGNGTGNSAGDPSTVFLSLNALGGATKAYLYFWNATNRQKWVLYRVTATASGGSAVTFTVVFVGKQTDPALFDDLYVRCIPCCV